MASIHLATRRCSAFLIRTARAFSAFRADCLWPSGVRGPVLIPPCHLQRPPLPMPSARQGCPCCVRALHSAGSLPSYDNGTPRRVTGRL